MAVCAYCNSTLVRDANAVRDTGKMGQVLEDYSPLQIPTSGHYEGRRFTLVGRIQHRYEDGFWNEWYAFFDDGRAGWLSDASGQYVFTLPFSANLHVPGFAQFHPGKPLVWEGKTFHASDVRTATCVAGEGELPFAVGAGYTVKAVDLRAEDEFLTLDFSEGETPQLFSGRSVTLADLRCELLRDNDTIQEKSGRLRGHIEALACPTCGHSIPFVPGAAMQLVCSACQAHVDSASPVAEALTSLAAAPALQPSLPLGEQVTLEGTDWQVLGVMAMVSEGDSPWGEYLLYHPLAGFLWLVELADGQWQLARVMNAWPEHWVNSTARVAGINYQMMYRYPARVVYAAGAFNWRVHVGDEQTNIDYVNGQHHLTMERNTAEIVWSLAEPLSADVVQHALGSKLQRGWLQKLGGPTAVTPREDAEQAESASATESGSALNMVAWVATIIVVVLNLTSLGTTPGLLITAIGLVLIWIPAWAA